MPTITGIFTEEEVATIVRNHINHTYHLDSRYELRIEWNKDHSLTFSSFQKTPLKRMDWISGLERGEE